LKNNPSQNLNSLQQQPPQQQQPQPSALEALNNKLGLIQPNNIQNKKPNNIQNKKPNNIQNKKPNNIQNKKLNNIQNKKLNNIQNKKLNNIQNKKLNIENKKLNIEINKKNLRDLDEEIKFLQEQIKKKENNEKETEKEPEKEPENKDIKIALIKLLKNAIDKQGKNESMNNENFNSIEPEKQEERNDMYINFDKIKQDELIKVIDEEDLNYTIPNNVKIRSTSVNNSFMITRNNMNSLVRSSIDLEVDSERATTYDCYNDYMVNLEKQIKLKDIKIRKIELPKRETENINLTNNELKISIDNKEQIFELEENYYNRYEIKDFLNEAFKIYNFEINCDIQDDIFIFNSTKKFIIYNHEKSILPLLGFNKNAYVNKNTYTAESSIQIGDNIYYLVIENISSKPLFYINKDNNEIKKLIDFEPIEIDNLIIKFYKTPRDIIKDNKEYNYFFNNKHKIYFELIERTG
jgi:hypothetical protein